MTANEGQLDGERMQGVADDVGTRPRLSPWRRILDTFIAPARVFEDILRDHGWGLPFVLLSASVYVYLFFVQQFVGWDTVAANITLHHSGAALDDATPERIHAITVAIVKATMYAYPLIILAFNAIVALVLSATINVACHGEAAFEKTLAVWTYAMLPRALAPLLTSLCLVTGMDRSTFYLDNPIGTNLAYYLPASSANWMMTVGSALDVFDLWGLVLAAIGLSIVGKVSRTKAFVVVFGWYCLVLAAKLAYASFS